MTYYYIGDESLATICKRNKLNLKNVLMVMYYKNFMPEDAIKYYIKTKEEREKYGYVKGHSYHKYEMQGFSIKELVKGTKINYNTLYYRIQNYMKKKSCKYEESIIGKVIKEEDFNKLYLNMLNLKIANNIRLTPQETKDYIELTNK